MDFATTRRRMRCSQVCCSHLPDDTAGRSLIRPFGPPSAQGIVRLTKSKIWSLTYPGGGRLTGERERAPHPSAAPTASAQGMVRRTKSKIWSLTYPQGEALGCRLPGAKTQKQPSAAAAAKGCSLCLRRDMGRRATFHTAPGTPPARSHP